MATGGRTYRQLCGLALSLDLLGERWTLLILRELSRGPKRFGDLLAGLGGIGTNLLSARLKRLEENGVVEQATLPAPASVTAYDLTDRGRSLEPILEDLAIWGLGLFDGQDYEELTRRAAWAAMSMKARMDRADHDPPEGVFAFDIGDEEFWLRTTTGTSLLRDGVPPFEPDVRLAAGPDHFFEIATGQSNLDQSGTEVTGDRQALERLLQTFRLPLPAPVSEAG